MGEAEKVTPDSNDFECCLLEGNTNASFVQDISLINGHKSDEGIAKAVFEVEGEDVEHTSQMHMDCRASNDNKISDEEGNGLQKSDSYDHQTDATESEVEFKDKEKLEDNCTNITMEELQCAEVFNKEEEFVNSELNETDETKDSSEIDQTVSTESNAMANKELSISKEVEKSTKLLEDASDYVPANNIDLDASGDKSEKSAEIEEDHKDKGDMCSISEPIEEIGEISNELEHENIVANFVDDQQKIEYQIDNDIAAQKDEKNLKETTAEDENQDIESEDVGKILILKEVVECTEGLEKLSPEECKNDKDKSQANSNKEDVPCMGPDLTEQLDNTNMDNECLEAIKTGIEAKPGQMSEGLAIQTVTRDIEIETEVEHTSLEIDEIGEVANEEEHENMIKELEVTDIVDDHGEIECQQLVEHKDDKEDTSQAEDNEEDVNEMVHCSITEQKNGIEDNEGSDVKETKIEEKSMQVSENPTIQIVNRATDSETEVEQIVHKKASILEEKFDTFDNNENQAKELYTKPNSEQNCVNDASEQILLDARKPDGVLSDEATDEAKATDDKKIKVEKSEKNEEIEREGENIDGNLEQCEQVHAKVQPVLGDPTYELEVADSIKEVTANDELEKTEPLENIIGTCDIHSNENVNIQSESFKVSNLCEHSDEGNTEEFEMETGEKETNEHGKTVTADMVSIETSTVLQNRFKESTEKQTTEICEILGLNVTATEEKDSDQQMRQEVTAETNNVSEFSNDKELETGQIPDVDSYTVSSGTEVMTDKLVKSSILTIHGKFFKDNTQLNK
jgi:hypothetical protein